MRAGDLLPAAGLKLNGDAERRLVAGLTYAIEVEARERKYLITSEERRLLEDGNPRIVVQLVDFDGLTQSSEGE
jgi:hypothetical protein